MKSSIEPAGSLTRLELPVNCPEECFRECTCGGIERYDLDGAVDRDHAKTCVKGSSCVCEIVFGKDFHTEIGLVTQPASPF